MKSLTAMKGKLMINLFIEVIRDMRGNNFFGFFLLAWTLSLSVFSTECDTADVEMLFKENKYVFVLKNVYSPLEADVRTESKGGVENEILSYPVFSFLYSFKGDLPESVNGLALSNSESFSLVLSRKGT